MNEQSVNFAQKERSENCFPEKVTFDLRQQDEQLGNLNKHKKNVVAGKRKNTGKGHKTWPSQENVENYNIA